MGDQHHTRGHPLLQLHPAFRLSPLLHPANIPGNQDGDQWAFYFIPIEVDVGIKTENSKRISETNETMLNVLAFDSF